ncbi:MAG: S8 family serine peptidase, partial [Planctomycetes bacterium]|nr:S8 family serine peptidase [Planctomycetota bacterium]
MPEKRHLLFALIAAAAASGLSALGQVPQSKPLSAGLVENIPADKLHPALLRSVEEAAGLVKAWVFFTDKGVDSPQEYAEAVNRVAAEYNPRATQRRMLRGTRAARGEALFNEHDLPVVRSYIDAVQATGARVHVTSKWVNAVSVYADRQQLNEIAKLPFVRKLQPVARAAKRIPPPVEKLVAESPRDVQPDLPDAVADIRLDYGNSEIQLTQINLIALHDEGFTGQGVIVGILDTGFHRTHEAFNHPLHPLNVIAEYDFVNNDGNTDIEGGDPSSQHNHGTMILGCLGAYMPGELVGGAYNASFVLAKTEDTTDEYPAEEDNYVAGLEFIEAHGADMSTSSLGYIDWYTQDDLDGLTAVTTIAINISTSLGVHHCNAAGNEYHDSNPNTSSLIAPSDGFDVITCGAVDSSGTIAYFSSDGPTADGRVKPEVLARGISTHTVSPSSDTGYTTADGTSLSTPLVACAVASLISANPQWTVAQMRDHLFETADYYVANGTYDPLYVRGYGIIDAFAAWADCNLNDIPDHCDVDCGEAGGPCDLPGCGGSLDCNANLVPDECEVDCNGNGIPDDCDMADCLPDDPLCADCNSNDVPDECDIPFPQQGRIELGSSKVPCEGTVAITVADCGLNVDDGIVETTTVTIDSDSEPGGESVLLTETGPSSGTFSGTVAVSETDVAGVLLVGTGDNVIATYVDAHDGLGGTDVSVTDAATVDCQGPVVSFVQVTDIGPFEATVTFQVDEPAKVTVHYGTACAALTEEVTVAAYQLSFQVVLDNLDKGTTYYFAIDAEDEAGNPASDDNDGDCYTFATEEIPLYYTELFDSSDNDLAYKSLTFMPNASVDFYAACGEDISELPTSPTGGATLSLSEDGYEQVSL